MSERGPRRQPEPRQTGSEPAQDEAGIESQPTPDAESVPQYKRAVEMLLDALDGCAGDPPTCPHCGPARRFAESLLYPDQPRNLQETEASPPNERLSLSGRLG